ncbi:DEAD-box ATP-dependent RNA helicase CshA [Methanobrevibacter cuticularis]|uniref:RNA helicase n=1 Tax=Methanobrevibacter cuticularis TaxID=47311 RepID=A0A166EM44_9EURY|nr:DEAD/DEAH box helicase [Methanobrevibacter cuticularis]KZX16803.1 DEAD-box ATP-dependent RNA helicase CshA [Methanobrevibacter cuticularis]
MEQISFDDLKISKEIKQAVKDMGFEEPTPIQSLTIPEALQGKDIIGQAQTGTGKTVAFGIPVLESIFVKDNSPQAIIICPTRELSIQVAEELGKLSNHMRKLHILPVYGGQPIGRQLRSLKKGVHIIIGTPGRLLDHIQRGTLDLSGIEIAVLDEADEMLDMGFREDIEKILRKTPKKRQTLLFSATMPNTIKKLTHNYQNNPKHLRVAQHLITVPEIEQFYFEAREKMKLETLSRLMDTYDINLALVFCNTKRRVDRLVRDLKSRGYSVDGIHGDLSQKQRDNVMNKFRKGRIDILVATDVAARGIDVPDVEAVFNYDVPNDNEYYVHRIGRTGRAGKTGYAFTFVAGKEIYKLRDIQKYTKSKIKQQKIPSIDDIKEMKVNILLNKIKQVIENDNLDKDIHMIESLVEVGYNSIDIAAALLKMNKEQ